ncbi:MAG: M3 family metallopeptidase [Thermoanaerobaculia bacterium]
MAKRGVHLLLALCLGAAAPASEDAARLETELAIREKRLADLSAEYWRTQYRVALGEKGASTLEVRARIREVLTEPVFLDGLSKARFSDRLAERRRRFFLDEATDARISGDPELAALTELLEKAYAAARFPVGGRRIARAELNTIVSRDPDRSRRRQAWEARAEMDRIAGARVREAMVLRERLARRFAAEPFPEFMLRRNQVDRGKLRAAFEQIRRGTEEEFARLELRMKRELGVERLEPWDLDFFFSRLSGPAADHALARAKAWPRICALALSLGYDIGKLPVALKVADIAFGGGTYPIRYGKEVRMLVNTYEGLTFTDTLLHEAGHALHYCFDAEPTFLLQSNYAQPFDEGLGQVMALLLYEPDVATKFFGLSREEAVGMAEAYRLGSVYDLRQRIASSLFEFEAYANPDQDLSTLYDRLYQTHVGVSTHALPVWAFNPFYATGPIYVQSYVLAEMVGRQVHRAVSRRFVSPWGQDAGEYLRERLFARGGSLTMDEILEDATGEPLSAAALIEALSSRP